MFAKPRDSDIPGCQKATAKSVTFSSAKKLPTKHSSEGLSDVRSLEVQDWKHHSVSEVQGYRDDLVLSYPLTSDYCKLRSWIKMWGEILCPGKTCCLSVAFSASLTVSNPAHQTSVGNSSGWHWAALGNRIMLSWLNLGVWFTERSSRLRLLFYLLYCDFYIVNL